MVSVSSLYAAILFSGFPFHEEIVASRVTLPFKGEGKRACVLEHKGIHSPTRPSSSNSLDSPHMTHTTAVTAGEKFLENSPVRGFVLICKSTEESAFAQKWRPDRTELSEFV